MNPFEEPASTREEILGAAYRALSTHGYAELTIDKIGEEFDKSASLIYHHYDGKDDLLLACLDFMLDRYKRDPLTEEYSGPRAAIEGVCERVLLADASTDHQQFIRTLIELRAQTPHDSDYREHFTRSDRVFRSHLAAIVEAGIEQGEFRAVDPDRTAVMLQVFLSGVFLIYVTSDDDEWMADARAELEAYLDARLYV